MGSNCNSCGGGRPSGGARKGVQAKPKRVASRSGKLPWAHISQRGAVARYATETEAQAAAKAFGGTVEKRTD